MHVMSSCDETMGETDPDIPASSSVASAVSESLWLSARPVQISCCRTASAMGITMAVVDVLLSHMDRNTVQHMKPSTSLEQETGTLTDVSDPFLSAIVPV